jgi:hypothetical protein
MVDDGSSYPVTLLAANGKEKGVVLRVSTVGIQLLSAQDSKVGSLQSRLLF